MNQLALSFEPVRARRSDPATSQRAAAKVDRFAGGHFAKIIADAVEAIAGKDFNAASDAGNLFD